MNEVHADSSAPDVAGATSRPEQRGQGWSRQRWLILVALVFAAQLAIIFAIGQRQFQPPRAVVNVPQLVLADNTSELIALDDPTLFALPHADDVASEMYAIPPPDFRWTEPPGELLSPAGKNLGTVFTRFMQTNRFAAPILDFKPAPKLSEPVPQLPPAFAENSTLHIEGELAQRKWLNPVNLTNWPYADVIAPSRVQVLVDAAGDVVSAVLLPPDDPEVVASHYDVADQSALELARRAVRAVVAPDHRPVDF